MDTDETRIEKQRPSIQTRMGKLLHEETTSRIIGSAFEVHSLLGYGFLEKIYQRALQVELIKRGSRAEIETAIKVSYKGIVIGDYYADLLVDESVIVEIKVAKTYCHDDEAQLLNELNATGIKVGLLVNFGRERVDYKRMIL